MRKILAIVFSLSLIASSALAQPCGSLPDNLTNGTVADATQVMANFNALLGCINDVGLVNSGTAGQVGYYNAAGNAISGESLSALMDSTFGSAQGSILYRDTGGWAALAPGSAGQFLETGGTGANPQWAAPAGSGNVTGPSSSTPGNCVEFNNSTGTLLKDAGSPCGSGGGTYPNVNRPALTAFTVTNNSPQGLISVDNAGGPINFGNTEQSLSGVVHHVSYGLQNISGGSTWQYTASSIVFNQTSSGTGGICPLMISDGTKFAGICAESGTSSTWAVFHWSSNSTAPTNAGSYGGLGTGAGLIWTRLAYNGTNDVWQISLDGYFWFTVLSETPYLTATSVGFGLDNAGGASTPMEISIFNWTSP